VKPANILLSPAGADQGDHAYLTDFGLTGGGSETSLTAAGGSRALLAYIAPSRSTGATSTAAVDCVLLACMAFECLTGRCLRARDRHRHCHGPHQVPPPSALAANRLPAAVDTVLARHAEHRRVPTCGAFLAEPALGAPTGKQITWPRSDAMGRVHRPWIIVPDRGDLVGVGVWLSTGQHRDGANHPAADDECRIRDGGASPTEDVYPNAAEAALVARSRLIPRRRAPRFISGDGGEVGEHRRAASPAPAGSTA
jgi:hypothetical protein